MLNVNALQKTLSAMTLPEIQNYASMHKNDPYVVAMALSVANTKKQAVTAQQGLAGMQQQPKVVDQDIAAIAPQAPAPVPAMGAAQLPENTGIGQLPAPNMQGMADGGIVAFDEGGHVPRYGGNMEDGSLVEARNPLAFLNPADLWAGTKDYFARKQIEAAQRGSGTMTGVEGYVPPVNQEAANARDMLMAQNREAAPDLAQQAGPASLAMDAGLAAGKGDTAGKDKGLATLGGAGAAAAPATGLGAFMTYLKENKPAGPEAMDKYMARREAYLGENPTKKQMERIDKQEAAALADKEESKAMALIKAGLGMMSGTSQHAFANIGQGAMGGLEAYAADQKEAKKLRAERDKMRDAIENAAFAYKKGDLDSYEKYAEEAKKAQATYAAHGLSALGSVTGAQIHANATMAAANAMPANMRAALALGEGATEKERLESGLAKLNAIGAEKTDLTFAKMYADHVNNAQKAMQQPMNPTEFATTIRSALAAYKPKVINTDNPNATVYDRQ